MKARTSREKWLLAVLPAWITAFVGWLVFVRPANREIANLHQRLVNQRPAAERLAQAGALRAELADREKAVADLRAAVPAPESAFDRNAALQQVSRLCAAHGLNLNGAVAEPGGVVPPHFLQAVANGVAAAPQVWRFDLRGSYGAMQRLLDDLGRAPVFIVPLTLAMTTEAGNRQASAWVLTLWL